MKDDELLRAVLQRDDEEERDERPPGRGLFQREREVFTEWLALGRPLSDKQRSWLESAAVRLDVLDSTRTANTFSSWSPERQAEERRRARRKAFEDMPRPAKPPRKS